MCPRLAPGDSLFDRTPPGTREEVQKPFCLCPRGSQTEPQDGRGSSPPAQSHCSAYQNVDYTSVFPSTDTTVEYFRSPGGPESVLDPLGTKVWSAGPGPQLGGGSSSRASAGFQPDLHRFVYFFPEDHLAEARPEVRPGWPTPTGLTSSRALQLCQLALANSTVGAACGGLLGRRLDEAVDLCVLDLQLKDELGWEEALLPYLENECERRLLENGTGGSSEGPHPAEVAAALRCPNRCRGNGACTERGCRCSSSSHDCSRVTGEYPGRVWPRSRLMCVISSPARRADGPGARWTL